MKQKTLFLDLDGTLLNDDKEISPANREALGKALEQGHKVIITTGRAMSSAVKQNQRLGLTDPGCYIIAYNGGMMMDSHTGRIIHQDNIPREVALRAIGIARELGVHIQTYDAAGVIVEPDAVDEGLAYYCNGSKIGYRIVENYAAALHCDVPKLVAIDLHDRQPLEALSEAVQQELGQWVDCYFSCREYLEIVPLGVNKGNAVGWMCQKLGIDIADSIAAGDADNDLSMIQVAGVGVAMANGSPAVRSAADYVTLHDNNHDGIAEVICKFLLEEA